MPKQFTRPWYQLWTKTENPDYTRYVRSFESFERELGERVARCKLMN